jgi:Domain of unknown function (DUF4259)
MGGWGTGSFENDDAQNWLGKLNTVADLTPLLARAAENTDYLEAPEASIAVAAAEVVAAVKGAPAEKLPKEISDWKDKIAAQPSSVAAVAALAPLAVQAVDRVRTNSELKDLWLEADGLNDWSAALRDLAARLTRSADS